MTVELVFPLMVEKAGQAIYNQLTAQFYRMDIDNQFPYRVYATQQDNTSISVPVHLSMEP